MAESISEGTLKSWLKKPGEFVNADEEVATIETDKVRYAVRDCPAGCPSSSRRFRSTHMRGRRTPCAMRDLGLNIVPVSLILLFSLMRDVMTPKAEYHVLCRSMSR